MKSIIILVTIVSLIACKNQGVRGVSDSVIAKGQMPQFVTENNGNLHMIYGKGDSLLYSFSADGGKTFNRSQVVGILPGLASSHMRGPQIALTSEGLLVTACTTKGDIFSFVRNNGRWAVPVKVTDEDTVAKENLMALSADGSNVVAVWLDLRSKHNQLFGAHSINGGRSWSENRVIYASPDTTVCQCCKPSVLVHDKNVYVMFRNWLKGNRDLYLVQSADGGKSFSDAKKLGEGNWPLKGCPMDGGGLTIDSKGIPQTVWNRQGVIYSCSPGKQEQKIGEGRSCTTEMINGKQVYAWVENKKVVMLTPAKKLMLSEGEIPVLKTIDNHHLLCAWENDKQIHRVVLGL
ncbi:MAG: sialidase family protein [Candidatus Dadabacteria bacterium]